MVIVTWMKLVRLSYLCHSIVGLTDLFFFLSDISLRFFKTIQFAKTKKKKKNKKKKNNISKYMYVAVCSEVNNHILPAV